MGCTSMFQATGMQMCVSRLMTPAVEQPIDISDDDEAVAEIGCD